MTDLAVIAPQDKNVAPLGLPVDPMAAPVPLSGDIGGTVPLFKIDAAVNVNGLILIAGWCTSKILHMELLAQEGILPSDLCRMVRADAPQQPQDQPGFVVVAQVEDQQEDILPLRVSAGGEPCHTQIELAQTIPEHARALIARGVFEQMRRLPIGSERWRRFLRAMPMHPMPERQMIGTIDQVALRRGLGFCSGWESHAPDTLVWLEDDQNGQWNIDEGFRWRREDVSSVVNELGDMAAEAGFMCMLRTHANVRSIRLCSCSAEGRTESPSVDAALLSADPKIVIRELLNVPSEWPVFPARARQVDLPLIGGLMAQQQKLWAKARVRVEQLGSPPQNPVASVIVPLHGRLDMIEHQLLEFQRDVHFVQWADLIYVLDDPALEYEMAGLAAHLHDLCSVPFRWVSAGQNRGYSGANNLGANHAQTEKLVFLNSDVFPLRAGWLAELLAALDERPDVGLVGPRLLFSDGTIQHAGMIPYWQPGLGLWTNRHPLMGMDAALDPARGPSCVPLLTGACLALRRSDFERVGGWDTGYLIGDFEDSDLCLKIRELGLRCLYLPETQLLHLERQSLGLEPDNQFRRAVTVMNAVRYNALWATVLDDLPS